MLCGWGEITVSTRLVLAMTLMCGSGRVRHCMYHRSMPPSAGRESRPLDPNMIQFTASAGYSLYSSSSSCSVVPLHAIAYRMSIL